MQANPFSRGKNEQIAQGSGAGAGEGDVSFGNKEIAQSGAGGVEGGVNYWGTRKKTKKKRIAQRSGARGGEGVGPSRATDASGKVMPLGDGHQGLQDITLLYKKLTTLFYVFSWPEQLNR